MAEVEHPSCELIRRFYAAQDRDDHAEVPDPAASDAFFGADSA